MSERPSVFLTPEGTTLIDELEHPPIPLRLVPPLEPTDPMTELADRVARLEAELADERTVRLFYDELLTAAVKRLQRREATG